ncbi:MAG TPA: MaoC family dehydratase [Devosiaceae bacterium]|nr:MaoC family dehydratase [Devosiaceae bacterium]
MNNPLPATRRYFEDLHLGETIELGRATVTREMIFEWAREFDPLPFHLDEEAAKKSLLGGLASSGWQTGALTLRLLGESFLNGIATAGGLGFSDLKWKKPVMVGDTISATATIAGLRRSSHHPERGILMMDLVVTNQKGDEVMTMSLANLVEAREPAAQEPAS